MDKIQADLLKEISNLDKMPQGAYNLRVDGKSIGRNSTEEIQIVPKQGKPGIDIYISKACQQKSVHIPVLLSQAGLNDMVYNDFHIEDGADVTIVAGCGIYNCSNKTSEHDGIHTFYIGKNAKVKYIEKHLGIGENNSNRVLNPTTIVFIDNGGCMIMETTQIRGVSQANRKTVCTLNDNAKLVINEKILTSQVEKAKTNFKVTLKCKHSSAEIVSRSVAKDKSMQTFQSEMIGKNECYGRVECDGILVGKSQIISIPKIKAQNVNSTLTHEATIGKIAGDELIKLQTLGLTKELAEQEIINGFLK